MFACLETRARSEGYMVKIFKTWCPKPYKFAKKIKIKYRFNFMIKNKIKRKALDWTDPKSYSFLSRIYSFPFSFSFTPQLFES